MTCTFLVLDENECLNGDTCIGKLAINIQALSTVDV